MKMRFSSFAFVVSIATLLPNLAGAEMCIPDNHQDIYSMDLAKKGLKRMKSAEKILARIEADAKRAMEQLKSNPGMVAAINGSDKLMPAKMINDAKCLVVIPGEAEIALGAFGFDFGEGIKVCKDSNGNFGKPTFMKVKGATWGAQIGAKATDRVLAFNGNEAESLLSGGRVELGVDASVTAFTVGRDASLQGDAGVDSSSESYSHSVGLYAGATLTGGYLEPDHKMDRAVQGQQVKRSWLARLVDTMAHFTQERSNAGVCPVQVAAAQVAVNLNTAINEAILPQAMEPAASVSTFNLGKIQQAPNYNFTLDAQNGSLTGSHTSSFQIQ